uniref:non-specific serine/threonine protein kinase n=1 Tax=Populus alba TaxID=43335 RepID=A0A4U5QGT7_POPAL|nr:hypothetical protein D5086_0000093860 [Populus alba]
MKCFHFSNGERREDEDAPVSKVSRVSWARSLSVASSSLDTRRSELDSDSYCYSSRDLSDSVGLFELLSQRRANDLRVFGFSELKSATRGFSRGLLIGEGGFGCVYRGVVKVPADHESGSKMDVAIKQLNRHGFQGHREWINEVNFLGVVKHPNLVKLVGYCAEDDERGIQRLLVYELMHNKSLEDHLLARVLPITLPWMTRLKIAQDAARGLAYLHEEMDFQLIFRDFKASNVLLDEDFNAKLSDFGLARQGPPEGLGHVSTSKFHLIVDPRLEGQCCIKSAQKLAALANRCLAKQPKSRPKMSEAVEILGNIISETSSQDEGIPEPVSEIEEVKEEATGETGAGSTKPGNSYRKKVFDIREMVNLRNRTTGKLDWRNWTPRLVRT